LPAVCRSLKARAPRWILADSGDAEFSGKFQMFDELIAHCEDRL
jgi:hypothetical protein